MDGWLGFNGILSTQVTPFPNWAL